jgi:sulfur carrier protein ThiS
VLGVATLLRTNTVNAGQFYDLIHLLSLTGSPSEKHALVFNGDFVDRGSWSVEVALTLFAYKCQSAVIP